MEAKAFSSQPAIHYQQMLDNQIVEPHFAEAHFFNASQQLSPLMQEDVGVQ